MPAVLQQWIEKSEERNRRIQQLRNEVTEIMELNVMDVTYRMLVEFLADEGIEHISEMDYILRKNYEVYMSELVKGNIVSRYLRIFDKVKQEYIRKRMETPMGRMECQWTYKNAILFIPYHSDQKIVQSVERVKNRSNMVWNFQIDSSEKMKRQIFDVLEFILENYEPSRVREQKLTGLHIFYEFCRLRKIEDINCLEQVQEEDFQIFLERKIENEQRRNRLRSIVGFVCRITFLQAKEIRWDATIWYLEKFKIPKERLNPSDPVERISFREVLHPENRKLLQEYMKYEIGIGEMAISTVYEKFRIIRNFLKEISDEQQKVTTCDAERIDQYLKKRQEDANEAKTFNTQVTSIQYFFKFLEVRGYVDKVPFRAEYYWEKQILVHHDRCVEEDVYMEIIQKLSNFPEHLRMMFLHLWCIGLRISEVCTLKGDAYYRQKGDYWMKIYQVKMKNYKRVPIPEALYDLMQVYLNKNRIAKEDYIFQNRKGGAFSKSTFNEQMKKYCAACDIQNGEYLLADIIDFDPKRTPSVLFSHLAVKNPVSLNEWKKHQSINAWTISPKRILFSAQCEHPAIEATILAFCNQIDEELRNGTVILSNLSDDGMGINMETYKIPLPPQVDRRKIQAKKDIISGKPIYRYHDTKFSLSKKQIIDLLMGTKLYGKPEVALRELLQNSIDACLLRQKLSELWGIEYTPKVKVSLYTKNNVDYLQVSDNGVGMNQHIIDNYYTNIGCSYYSSREFSDLMVSFKSSFTPISRFGIGILSCFMVCDSMEVTTRRIRERFECDEALHVSIEGYESLFVISDSDKKDPGTDTILTLRPVHPWDRMDEDEFVQCIKGIVPNPAVQIEIETDKRSESYSSDYFDDLDLSPLLDYSWNNTKNIRKIDIDLTCEEYGFKGRGCIGILIKNDMPVEEIEILSKDVEIDGEIYTLSSSVKYKNNCITETSTSISVDEDGEIDTNTSWSERFKSKSSLSIHGIEVPYNLFPNYSNKMSKAVLNILFPFSFRLDIGVNSDLNLNSARDQIIYDEKWLTFEENLYQVICKRLKEQLSLSDWERLNEIIQKNGKNIFSRVANNIE